MGAFYRTCYFTDSSTFLPKQVDHQQTLVRIAWIGHNLTPTFITKFRDATRDLLFFSWWPGTLSTLPSVTPVSFPTCTGSQDIEDPTTYKCRYELHTLEKHAYASIEEKAVIAFQVIS